MSQMLLFNSWDGSSLMDERSLPVFASTVTDMFAKFDTAQAQVHSGAALLSFCHCAARSIPHRVILYMYVLHTRLCAPAPSGVPTKCFHNAFFWKGARLHGLKYGTYSTIASAALAQSGPFPHAQYRLRHTVFSGFLRFLLLAPLDFMGKSASSVRYTFQPIAAPGRQYGRGTGRRTTSSRTNPHGAS